MVIVDLDLAESEKMTKLRFLCDEMELKCLNPPPTKRDAINLYLGSPNAYEGIRNLLILQLSKTIKSYFGKLGPASSLEE